jgi:hypothetical protein
MHGGYAVILLVRAKRAALEILAEKAQFCGERKGTVELQVHELNQVDEVSADSSASCHA